MKKEGMLTSDDDMGARVLELCNRGAVFARLGSCFPGPEFDFCQLGRQRESRSIAYAPGMDSDLSVGCCGSRGKTLCESNRVGGLFSVAYARARRAGVAAGRRTERFTADSIV